jgi:hypothetical protein
MIAGQINKLHELKENGMPEFPGRSQSLILAF